MGYTLLDQRRLDGAFQLANVVRHEVGEVGVFDMAPAGFDRIQFRGVGRQPLKLDARNGQRLDPPGGRTMNAPAIKTDDKRPTESLAQLLNEADDVLGANVLFLNLKRSADSTPCRRERHCADYAHAVIAVPGPLNRRDASEGPRAAIHWLQAEASFIEKDDRCAVAIGFFLTRGQSQLRQRSTASASCSRATCRGFCGLKPSSCKMRDKCPGWYSTLNRFRITAAIRKHVHRSVRYPAAVGPASTISISSSRCASESLGAGPGCRLAAKASTPPAFHAVFQRLTLERSTPNCSATVRRDFPAWKYSAARRRRASSSAALPVGLMHTHTVLAIPRVRSRRKDQ